MIEDSPTALRFDTGKIRYELIPTHLLKPAIAVFEKYKTTPTTRLNTLCSIIGDIKYHLSFIEIGIDIDADGLEHIGYVIYDSLMLEHYMNMMEADPTLKEKFDDRPTIFAKF